MYVPACCSFRGACQYHSDSLAPWTVVFRNALLCTSLFSQCCIVSHASLYGRTDPRRCYKDDLEESVQNIILKVMLIFEELASGNAQSEFEIILISLHVITLERTFASLLKE